jgi:hypothetical protein
MAKRPLWIIAALLLGAAGALWGATGLSWLPTFEPPPPGTQELYGIGVGDGMTTTPDFTTLGWLAVASLAGVYALRGWTRRLLGAIIAVAGGYVCWQAIDTEGMFDLLTGRGLALLGGVLFVAAGLLIGWFAEVLPTMGAKYERTDAERRSNDPDKDLWDGLSDGEDPTADGPRT